MKTLWRYVAHDDPLVAACNMIALVLGYNTPLYPVYLVWIGGWGVLPGALLTWCACPFFLAVPWLSRRRPLAARIMLPTVGTANTVFCTWLFGSASGTALFLIPCVTLAALLFRRRERVVMLCTAALPVAAYCLMRPDMAAWLPIFRPAQTHAVFALNAASVGLLGVFLGAVFSGVYVARENTNS